jgi:hypothetical protein
VGIVSEVVARTERNGGRPGVGAWSAWLVAGLVTLVYLIVPVWTLAGGRRADVIAPVPANPKVTLASGQKIRFAAGDLGAGDAIVCESNGLSVGAYVPRLGHTSNARQVNADATSAASIEIVARRNGTVIASCS